MKITNDEAVTVCSPQDPANPPILLHQAFSMPLMGVLDDNQVGTRSINVFDVNRPRRFIAPYSWAPGSIRQKHVLELGTEVRRP